MEPRVPPHSLVSERRILGAMMTDERHLAACIDRLNSDMFYWPAHQVIYTCIADLFSEHKPADLTSIYERLDFRKQLETAGGAKYLTDLCDEFATEAGVESSAKLIEQCARRRRMIRATREGEALLYDTSQDSDEVIDAVEQSIFAAAQVTERSQFMSIKQIAIERIDEYIHMAEHAGEVTGLTTGFKQLDEMTTGFHPGDFIIIAARPSMGKTALAMNMAEHMAIDKKLTVCVFSIEMPNKKLFDRIVSSRARIDGQHIRTGKFSKPDMEGITFATAEICKAKLFIDQSPTLTPMEMRAKLRRMAAEHKKIDAVVVDYIQLMTAPGHDGYREQEVSAISRNMKAVAKDMGLAVIALAQLNRDNEKNQRKGIPARPMLSNLRESGSLEQDADTVMMIHRPGFYNKDIEHPDDAEIIIAKQRNGPTGIVNLKFIDRFSRFEDRGE